MTSPLMCTASKKRKNSHSFLVGRNLAHQSKMDKHVNLLYIQDDNEGHFAWIKNLSRLISSQLSKKEHKKFFCDRYVYIY